MKKLFLSLAVVAALVLGSAPAVRAQNEITLLAPGPFRAALEKLIPAFESKTGFKVKPTWGTGTSTRQQVARGEVFDVPIMFAPFPDALASGHVIASSATPLAGLVLAVTVRKGAPKPDISTPEAVRRILLEAKSISYVDPAIGTIGFNARETIQKLGVSEQLKAKTKLAESGAAAQVPVANGEIEICLGPYLSDPRNPGVDLVGGLPRSVSTPTAVVGFISSHAKDPATAKALLQYLSSPEAAAVYKEMMMEPGH